jgi:hypothetical protein
VNGLQYIRCRNIGVPQRSAHTLAFLPNAFRPDFIQHKMVAVLTYDDNRDCTIHITSLLLLLFRSNILKWCSLYQIILFVRREALTKCNAYDFSFAKLAQAAF